MPPMLPEWLRAARTAPFRVEAHDDPPRMLVVGDRGLSSHRHGVSNILHNVHFTSSCFPIPKDPTQWDSLCSLAAFSSGSLVVRSTQQWSRSFQAWATPRSGNKACTKSKMSFTIDPRKN